MDNEDRIKKRKRINRIKRLMIGFILVWMIVSVLLSVYLILRVKSLKEEVEGLKSENSDLTEKLSFANELLPSDDEDERYVKIMFLTDDLIKRDSEFSDDILKALDETGVKAAFFLCGTEDTEPLNLYKKIKENGMEVGITSYSGGYDVYNSKEDFSEDIKKMKGFYREIYGKEANTYLFPGGSKNKVKNIDTAELIKVLKENDLSYIDYNIYGNNVCDILDNVLKYRTAVILIDTAGYEGSSYELVNELVSGLRDLDIRIL